MFIQLTQKNADFIYFIAFFIDFHFFLIFCPVSLSQSITQNENFKFICIYKRDFHNSSQTDVFLDFFIRLRNNPILVDGFRAITGHGQMI